MTTRARAPLRLGLAGGGTDLSPYCQRYGGAILNVTIDRHAYAFIAPRDDGKVSYSALDIGVEETFDAAEAMTAATTLELHRGVYRRICMDYLNAAMPALSIGTTVDAPAGSGLGSSSALVVALVEAFRAHYALPLGRYEIAHLAWEIERVDLGQAGGRQDHYSAAFGGANFIEFLPNDRVIVNPLRLVPGAMEEIESSIAICFTGQSRRSHDIIMQQTAGITAIASEAIEAMHQLKADAHDMKLAFVHGDISNMSKVMHRSWIAKRKTADGVSNSVIDQFQNVAMQNGALAGKISGAGGGGFMMFLVRPEQRQHLINSLRAAGGDAGAVAFTHTGSVTWKATT